MLHLETVEPGTLELIRQLQEDIPSSFLVGGTSLALRKGYRKSVDIDHSDTVNLIGHDYKWQDIKTRLESMTQYFEKIFSQPPCLKTVNEGKSFKMR